MLQRLFHVNICVRDMERSIRFYQDLGFTKVNDFTLDDPSVGDALGVKAKKLRGVFMRTRPSTTSASAASPSRSMTSTRPTRSLGRKGSSSWRRSRSSLVPAAQKSA